MRRYPSFGRTPEPIKALSSQASQGLVPATIARRKYPQFGRTLNLVATLPSLGTPTSGGGGSTSRHLSLLGAG